MSPRSPFRLSGRPTVLLCRTDSTFHINSRLYGTIGSPSRRFAIQSGVLKKNLPALRVEGRGDIALTGAGGGTRTREYLLGGQVPYRLATPAFGMPYIIHGIPIGRKHFFRNLPLHIFSIPQRDSDTDTAYPNLRIRWDSSIASSSYLGTCRRCPLSPSSPAPRSPSRSPRSSRRCRRGVSGR